MNREELKALLEDFITDAYDLGHAHALNFMPPPRRVDDGWEQILNGAVDALSPKLAKAGEVADAYRELSAALNSWDPGKADAARQRLICLERELADLFELSQDLCTGRAPLHQALDPEVRRYQTKRM